MSEEWDKRWEEIKKIDVEMSEPIYYCKLLPHFFRKKQHFNVICEIEVIWRNSGQKFKVKGHGAQCHEPYKKDLIVTPYMREHYGMSFWAYSMVAQAEAAYVDAMIHIHAMREDLL